MGYEYKTISDLVKDINEVNLQIQSLGNNVQTNIAQLYGDNRQIFQASTNSNRWKDGYYDKAGVLHEPDSERTQKYLDCIQNPDTELTITIENSDKNTSLYYTVTIHAYNKDELILYKYYAAYCSDEVVLTYPVPANTTAVKISTRTFDTEETDETGTTTKKQRLKTTIRGTRRIYSITNAKSDIQMISSDIRMIQNRLPLIPAYWDDALNTVKNKVLAHDLLMKSGDRFFFVTDPHWRSQTNKMSSNIISELADYFQIKLCLIGGDLVASKITEQQEGYKQIANYIRSFKNNSLRLFATTGNHDLYNIDILSQEQIYTAMMSQMENFCITTGNLKGAYYDNMSKKIRYIQFQHDTKIDNSVDDTLRTWLTDKCTNLPDANGWAIVLLSHVYWNNGQTPAYSQRWVKFFLRLKQYGAPIAVWLVGHTHLDQHAFVSVTTDENNNETINEEPFSTDSSITKLLVVSTTTDNVSPSQTSFWKLSNNPDDPYQDWGEYDETQTQGIRKSNRQNSSPYESAFDLIHLDTIQKKIYFTRIGGWFTGQKPKKDATTSPEPLTGDRAYNYDTGQILVYETGEPLPPQTNTP